PKGGALTLNATGGVGMLGVGVVGAVLLGFIQDTAIESRLRESHPEIHSQVVENKGWVFGSLDAVNPEQLDALPEQQRQVVTDLSETAKKEALATVAIFPGIMLVCYLILILY